MKIVISKAEVALIMAEKGGALGSEGEHKISPRIIGQGADTVFLEVLLDSLPVGSELVFYKGGEYSDKHEKFVKVSQDEFEINHNDEEVQNEHHDSEY